MTAKLLFAALVLPFLGASAAEKPNILLIYTDDHGWADLGAQGVNKDIRTPNLDQFARDGIRFARGYVSAPQCVPSRAGVLTGRYQQRFGVEDNNKGPLPLEELTIAERLKPAGYLTGQVGKWHLDLGGEKSGGRLNRIMPDHMPNAQGFDEYWRGEMKQFYASHDLNGQAFADAPKLVMDDRFRVVVQTEAALSFLDRRASKPEQPWFLYLAWFAPHVPLESPEPWFSQTPASLPMERRQALSMIAAMDDGLGRIRARLRQMGADRNTLIFVISDNGAPLTHGAWNGSLNEPLVGEKGMLTDGGIRTPFMACWPGTIPAGQVYEHPVSSLDVASTAVALAGLKHDDKLDGVDLMPFVTGRNKVPPHDFLFWRWRSQAAVLEFPWKLIYLGARERFLFDVTQPDGESVARNQLSSHPEIVSRLETRLKAWSDSLQPPGLPSEVVPQDARFFNEHHLASIDEEALKPKRGKKDTGWICRNGTITIKEGVMTVTQDSAARAPAFLANSSLAVQGPVRMTLKLRAAKACKGAVSWRREGDNDFVAGQEADFAIAEGGEMQTITVQLPVDKKVIHTRLRFPRDAAPEIALIEFAGTSGKPVRWDYSQPAATSP